MTRHTLLLIPLLFLAACGSAETPHLDAVDELRPYNEATRCEELGKEDCAKVFPGQFGNTPTPEQCIIEKAHEPLHFWGSYCPYGDCTPYLKGDLLVTLEAARKMNKAEDEGGTSLAEKWYVLNTHYGDGAIKAPQEYQDLALRQITSYRDENDLRDKMERRGKRLLMDDARRLVKIVDAECGYTEPPPSTPL